ncbi:biotin/lipoyl-binding protein [Crossiella sp. SN42]|uniref:acetyl/propionyl/methylcrotonyl-CoA carboxylase subunit alpha n=1 Tax=Crossiella sp. SN42 TaxID=2944808 RepID=UPI00207CA842|nr:biotin carboxylase N-terminal domain-containing protein [Crossiella sp. SN42]MCO1578646.1 biotin/lipoyl-binding protein [Crossiella sp. SN42]
MITRVLVANRGEIARRVFRTCRALGIGTVAVFSDADAESPHVTEADLAVRLPGLTPGETYLRAEALIAAAHSSGADAVHPGYGFLSENAEFARAVLNAGLVWIGPPPEAIEAMGAKVEAKKLMAEAGVPVLPELDPGDVTEFPLLVKASAGGGGRGMRIVRAPEELAGAVAAARAEAASAFGDGTVFCEPYLEHGRHVEIQVLADAHGAVWALGERDCSVQRRYQKVVEESPSPAVDEALREAMSAAAVAAARAIGYRGAGTVEFMVSAKGEFYFLETNTRLQVEHPVTEAVFGVDLVAWQLAIAEGSPLPAEGPVPRGHAIEVRLYAEDPAADWRPGSGPLHRFAVSGVDSEFTGTGERGLRLDAGVVDGSVISTHYDPMLAKVIAWAPTRAEAARRLAAALAGARIHGPATNRDLLVRVLRDADFLAGRVDTGFLTRPGLDLPLAEERGVRISALAAALAEAAANRAAATVQPRVPAGWRNLHSANQVKTYDSPQGTIEVEYRFTRNGIITENLSEVNVVSAAPESVVVEVDGVRRTLHVARYGDQVFVDSPFGPVTLRRLPRFTEPGAAHAEGSLLAPMPGTVVAVTAAPGDTVRAGQELLVLEAMKMQHPVRSPADGVLTELAVTAGAQVEAGAVLAVIEPAPTGPKPMED